MSIAITFREAWVPDLEDDQKKRPLSELPDAEEHIHGTLSIVVGGKPLPMLGFFGPDDACLGSWAVELSNAVRKLSAADPSSYVYDEGEQGQPAFVFERHGNSVSVTVSKSLLSGGDGDQEWGTQTCTLSDFVEQVRRYLSDLQAAIDRAVPGMGLRWFQEQSIQPL